MPESMTDLNLFIANVLEPMPSHKTAPRQIAPGSPSVNGGWQCPGWTEAGGYIWQPRSFSTDPAAILMLMERMLAPVDRRVQTLQLLGPIHSEGDYCLSLGGFMKDKDHVNASSIGEAVCLAFARAHGYKDGQ